MTLTKLMQEKYFGEKLNEDFSTKLLLYEKFFY